MSDNGLLGGLALGGARIETQNNKLTMRLSMKDIADYITSQLSTQARTAVTIKVENNELVIEIPISILPNMDKILG
ncbi:hypothetical protein [Methanocella conradii]|uniref:hypothetical protein n=1 Tax=Methanocella conradii TaxID=1175444 RepID=UPI00157DABBE|nr:hypothetical protein [Methanocella conradii]